MNDGTNNMIAKAAATDQLARSAFCILHSSSSLSSTAP